MRKSGASSLKFWREGLRTPSKIVSSSFSLNRKRRKRTRARERWKLLLSTSKKMEVKFQL